MHCRCPKNIPIQDNKDDCGVFTAVYADYVARAAPMLFSAADMPVLRLKLAGEIASVPPQRAFNGLSCLALRWFV